MCVLTGLKTKLKNRLEVKIYLMDSSNLDLDVNTNPIYRFL